MGFHDLTRLLQDPSKSRSELVILLRQANFDGFDLVDLVLCFPRFREPGRRLVRREVMSLLGEAGHDVGQAVMDALEAEGSFERTGEYRLGRNGHLIPCYRPVDGGHSTSLEKMPRSTPSRDWETAMLLHPDDDYPT